jgi:cobalt-zinc-cadmium efflux system protein
VARTEAAHPLNRPSVMSHEHSHSRSSRTGSLAGALALVLGYTAAEFIGGWLSGSLALLADAGHMVSDAAALALTLLAIRFASRPPTPDRTYGYHRAEILAALANGVTLVVIALFIVVEAYDRLQNPRDIASGLMVSVATGGLAVNLAGLWILRGGHSHDLNVRGAWLHVLTDALGSIQAIVAGLLIWVYGWIWVDPIASILIATLVIYSSWTLIRQSVGVLMEGTPSHIEVGAVRAALEDLPDVCGVHDLHVWTITSGFVALSTHIDVDEGADMAAVLKSAERLLAGRFTIRHTTIQIDRSAICDQVHHDVH